MGTHPFCPADRARIVERYREPAPPVPPNYGPVGPVLLILSIPLAVFAPAVAALLGDWSRAVLRLTAAAVALAGIAFWLFGGSRRASEVRRRARHPLDWLATEFDAGDMDARLTAAVDAIRYAYDAPGPYTYPVYDAEAEAHQLGSALSFVAAVERVLIEEVGAYRVFTGEEESTVAE